jgi:hypothetical protein
MKRLLQTYLALLLGASLAALFAKFALQSKGDPSSEEIDLVSIYGGVHLVSEATPFYGGRSLTVFAGTLLDLRKAQPAPDGIHLDITVIMGGLSLIVPPGWRVRNDADVLAGGFEDLTQPSGEEDAPVLRLTGRVVFGGLQVTTRSPVEAVA